MSQGYTGTFVGGLTSGYRIIGAVQRAPNGLAFPGAFVGGRTTATMTIGAVQTQEPPESLIYNPRSFFQPFIVR